jgi:hypothetical protein
VKISFQRVLALGVVFASLNVWAGQEEIDAFYRVNWRLWAFHKENLSRIDSSEGPLDQLFRLFSNSGRELLVSQKSDEEKALELKACNSDEWLSWRRWYTPYGAEVVLRRARPLKQNRRALPVMNAAGHVKVRDIKTKRKFFIHPSNLRQTRPPCGGIMGTPREVRELIAVFPLWGNEQYAVGAPVSGGVSDLNPARWVLLRFVTKHDQARTYSFYQEVGPFSKPVSAPKDSSPRAPTN